MPTPGPTRIPHAFLVAMVAAVAGCGTTAAVDVDVTRQLEEVTSVPAVPAGAVPVSVREIPGARTPYSTHHDSSRVVIRGVSGWESFWRGIAANQSPEPPAPVIDFDRYTVLAATLGQRPSGGYAIGIDSVYLSGGVAYAVVTAVSPGPDCGVAAVMTAPVVAVMIDRVTGPLRFVERRKTIACG